MSAPTATPRLAKPKRLPEGVVADEPDWGATKYPDGVVADRFTLRWRSPPLARSGPPVAFIGLNPSTASHLVADSTLIRCWGYTRAWGGGSLLMLNLFSARGTEPECLLDYAGEDANVDRVAVAAQQVHVQGGTVVAAWGAVPSGRLGRIVRSRIDWMCDTLAFYRVRLMALGLAADGMPRHPLMMPGDATLTPWKRPAAPW